MLTELSVGEALVSMLDENGSPQIVERAKIVPPHSQVGAITPEQRKQIIDSSVLAGHYEKAIDRESAYEKLQARAGEKTKSAGSAPVTGDQPARNDHNPLSFQRHSELRLLHFSRQLGRAALFTIRLLLHWPRVRCAPRAANSAGKSRAACLAESSAAAGDGDRLQGQVDR